MSGPMPSGGAPFTSTRPSRIQRSASRLEEDPARARNWLSRTVGGRDLRLGLLGIGRFGFALSRLSFFRHALPLLQERRELLQLGQVRQLVDSHVGEELLR